MARRYRPRKEYRFWLYHDLIEDVRLMEFIGYLKATKQFARVVRDGIRLIWSLKEGNNEVLFELFPHLQRQFKPDAEELIEQFRLVLMQQRPILVDSVASQPQQSGSAKPMDVPQFALPLVDEDTDDTLQFTQQTGGGSIGAMMARVTEMMRVPAD